MALNKFAAFQDGATNVEKPRKGEHIISLGDFVQLSLNLRLFYQVRRPSTLLLQNFKEKQRCWIK
jgi:hypothetical protein